MVIKIYSFRFELDFKMAIKEKIKNALELEKRQIYDSKHLTQDEKLQLTELVSEAAECTNGYEESEKVQRVAETTFHVTTAMAKVMQQLAENNDLTKELDETMKTVIEKEEKIAFEVQKIAIAVDGRMKKDIRDLNWKNTFKLALVKQPWPWLLLGVIAFSPVGNDFFKWLMKLFQ